MQILHFVSSERHESPLTYKRTKKSKHELGPKKRRKNEHEETDKPATSFSNSLSASELSIANASLGSKSSSVQDAEDATLQSQHSRIGRETVKLWTDSNPQSAVIESNVNTSTNNRPAYDSVSGATYLSSSHDERSPQEDSLRKMRSAKAGTEDRPLLRPICDVTNRDVNASLNNGVETAVANSNGEPAARKGRKEVNRGNKRTNSKHRDKSRRHQRQQQQPKDKSVSHPSDNVPTKSVQTKGGLRETEFKSTTVDMRSRKREDKTHRSMSDCMTFDSCGRLVCDLNTLMHDVGGDRSMAEIDTCELIRYGTDLQQQMKTCANANGRRVMCDQDRSLSRGTNATVWRGRSPTSSCSGQHVDHRRSRSAFGQRDGSDDVDCPGRAATRTRDVERQSSSAKCHGDDRRAMLDVQDLVWLLDMAAECKKRQIDDLCNSGRRPPDEETTHRKTTYSATSADMDSKINRLQLCVSGRSEVAALVCQNNAPMNVDVSQFSRKLYQASGSSDSCSCRHQVFSNSHRETLNRSASSLSVECGGSGGRPLNIGLNSSSTCPRTYSNHRCCSSVSKASTRSSKEDDVKTLELNDLDEHIVSDLRRRRRRQWSTCGTGNTVPPFAVKRCSSIESATPQASVQSCCHQSVRKTRSKTDRWPNNLSTEAGSSSVSSQGISLSTSSSRLSLLSCRSASSGSLRTSAAAIASALRRWRLAATATATDFRQTCTSDNNDDDRQEDDDCRCSLMTRSSVTSSSHHSTALNECSDRVKNEDNQHDENSADVIGDKHVATLTQCRNDLTGLCFCTNIGEEKVKQKPLKSNIMMRFKVVLNAV